jgi:hypothetical protein
MLIFRDLLKKNNQSSLNEVRDFLQAVKKLRKLNIETPQTQEYEDELRAISMHPTDTWYKDQGEHWEGWLKSYNGPGFYKRKNHKRKPSYIYNHIMCPPMILWLVETTGFDEKAIDETIKITLQQDKYQTQCKFIRKEFPWSDVEERILSTI